MELASIERRGDLLALLAGRAGGLLVPAALANQSGIPRTTLVRYLELLSSVFLIKTIPAWSSGQTQRAVGTPKLAFVETGVACHLISQDAGRLGEPGGAARTDDGESRSPSVPRSSTLEQSFRAGVACGPSAPLPPADTTSDQPLSSGIP
ncbi:MAG: DUF4143 domain-containing protein, partial [Pseudonocardiaceae bacterium]